MNNFSIKNGDQEPSRTRMLPFKTSTTLDISTLLKNKSYIYIPKFYFLTYSINKIL